ncbi:MAG TPA: hypothetical protein VNG69_02300 [Casimicrobiaceae bacterium]|nr:hypothetical protein [Casimicrobiaceae bacterium]
MADGKAGRIAEAAPGKIRRGHFEHRDIRVRVVANDSRPHAPAIGDVTSMLRALEAT